GRRGQRTPRRTDHLPARAPRLASLVRAPRAARHRPPPRPMRARGRPPLRLHAVEFPALSSGRPARRAAAGGARVLELRDCFAVSETPPRPGASRGGAVGRFTRPGGARTRRVPRRYAGTRRL